MFGFNLSEFFGGVFKETIGDPTGDAQKGLQQAMAYDLKARFGLLKEGEVRPADAEEAKNSTWYQYLVGWWWEPLTEVFGQLWSGLGDLIAPTATKLNDAVVAKLDEMTKLAKEGKEPLGTDVPKGIQESLLKVAAETASTTFKDGRVGMGIADWIRGPEDEAKANAKSVAKATYQAVYEEALVKLLESRLNKDLTPGGKPYVLTADDRKNALTILNGDADAKKYAQSIAERITGYGYREIRIHGNGKTGLRLTAIEPRTGLYGAIYDARLKGEFTSITMDGAIVNAADGIAAIDKAADDLRQGIITNLTAQNLGVTGNAKAIAALKALIDQGKGKTDHKEYLTEAEIRVLNQIATENPETFKSIKALVGGQLENIKDIDFTDGGIVIESKLTGLTFDPIKYHGSEEAKVKTTAKDVMVTM
ncbi:MAG: hypothetical protein MRY32_04610 [Rickettsiales bacterium]|nr:hypothetical protein [Rickettsiales bacterium]